MTDRDLLEEHLMLARSTSWAPAQARARVRANLVASGALSATTAPGAMRWVGATQLTTALLVGASFVAGYWVGFERSVEPQAPGAAHGPPSAPERAPTAATREATAGTLPVAAPPEPLGTVPAAAASDAAQPGASTPSDAPPARATLSQRATPRSQATPSQRDRSTPGRAQRASAPAPSQDPIAEELMLLSRAERAIRAEQPLLAVSFLDELDSRFPASAMLEERTAARLLAECGLSNPGARRRAELFLSDRAASVYTVRVRRSCGLDESATTPASLAPRATDGSAKSGH